MLGNLNVEAFEGGDPAGMIGEQTDAAQFEVGENLSADADIALTGALIFRQRGQGAILVELQGEFIVQRLDGEAERALVQIDDGAAILFGDAA